MANIQIVCSDYEKNHYFEHDYFENILNAENAIIKDRFDFKIGDKFIIIQFDTNKIYWYYINETYDIVRYSN